MSRTSCRQEPSTEENKNFSKAAEGSTLGKAVVGMEEGVLWLGEVEGISVMAKDAT